MRDADSKDDYHLNLSQPVADALVHQYHTANKKIKERWEKRYMPPFAWFGFIVKVQQEIEVAAKLMGEGQLAQAADLYETILTTSSRFSDDSFSDSDQALRYRRGVMGSPALVSSSGERKEKSPLNSVIDGLISSLSQMRVNLIKIYEELNNLTKVIEHLDKQVACKYEKDELLVSSSPESQQIFAAIKAFPSYLKRKGIPGNILEFITLLQQVRRLYSHLAYSEQAKLGRLDSWAFCYLLSKQHQLMRAFLLRKNWRSATDRAKLLLNIKERYPSREKTADSCRRDSHLLLAAYYTRVQMFQFAIQKYNDMADLIQSNDPFMTHIAARIVNIRNRKLPALPKQFKCYCSHAAQLRSLITLLRDNADICIARKQGVVALRYAQATRSLGHLLSVSLPEAALEGWINQLQRFLSVNGPSKDDSKLPIRGTPVYTDGAPETVAFLSIKQIRKRYSIVGLVINIAKDLIRRDDKPSAVLLLKLMTRQHSILLNRYQAHLDAYAVWAQKKSGHYNKSSTALSVVDSRFGLSSNKDAKQAHREWSHLLLWGAYYQHISMQPSYALISIVDAIDHAIKAKSHVLKKQALQLIHTYKLAPQVVKAFDKLIIGMLHDMKKQQPINLQAFEKARTYMTLMQQQAKRTLFAYKLDLIDQAQALINEGRSDQFKPAVLLLKEHPKNKDTTTTLLRNYVQALIPKKLLCNENKASPKMPDTQPAKARKNSSSARGGRSRRGAKQHSSHVPILIQSPHVVASRLLSRGRQSAGYSEKAAQARARKAESKSHLSKSSAAAPSKAQASNTSSAGGVVAPRIQPSPHATALSVPAPNSKPQAAVLPTSTLSESKLTSVEQQPESGQAAMPPIFTLRCARGQDGFYQLFGTVPTPVAKNGDFSFSSTFQSQ